MSCRSWEQGPRYNPILYAEQAARNAFYSHLRRRGIQLVLEPGRSAGAGSDLSPWIDRLGDRLGMNGSPSEQVIRDEDAERYRRLILDALRQLTAKERTVLLLRYGEGMSSDEVAEELGYKNAAVVNTMSTRARAKLEQMLSPSLVNWAAGGHR